MRPIDYARYYMNVVMRLKILFLYNKKKPSEVMEYEQKY